jgi:hypothetical protein
MKKYIVLKTFADKNNIAKHYSPGDELPPEFGKDRLENIVKLGLASVEDPDAGNPVTDIDLTGNVATIISKIKGFADVEKLTQYLETEKSAENPRETVVKAIEKRLEKIVKE